MYSYRISYRAIISLLKYVLETKEITFHQNIFERTQSTQPLKNIKKVKYYQIILYNT